MKKKVCILSFMIFMLLTSCTANSKTLKFFLKDCLITVEELPEGNFSFSGYVLPPVLPKVGAKSAIAAYFEVDGKHSAHIVYRYNNSFWAGIYARINREIYFPSSILSWQKVEGSDKWNLHADEWKIQCATSDDEFLSDHCTSVMRYGKYIITYSLPLNNETGTYENFEDIVFIIDQKMVNILQE